MGMPNNAQAHMKNLKIPFLTLEVEALMSANLQRATSLRQSILKKALACQL